MTISSTSTVHGLNYFMFYVGSQTLLISMKDLFAFLGQSLLFAGVGQKFGLKPVAETLVVVVFEAIALIYNAIHNVVDFCNWLDLRFSKYIQYYDDHLTR